MHGIKCIRALFSNLVVSKFHTCGKYLSVNHNKSRKNYKFIVNCNINVILEITTHTHTHKIIIVIIAYIQIEVTMQQSIIFSFSQSS